MLKVKDFMICLATSQLSLWDGCVNCSKLSTLVRLLNVKTRWKAFEQCYNAFVQLMKEALLQDNQAPDDFYRMKKNYEKVKIWL